MEFIVGASFMLPTPVDHDLFREHLAFQLTGPKWDREVGPRSVLIVTAQSVRNGGHDATCILRRGDHPFIQHDSYIGYARARVVGIDKLRELDELGRIRDQGVAAPQLLQRICAGLMGETTRPRIRTFFNLG